MLRPPVDEAEVSAEMGFEITCLPNSRCVLEPRPRFADGVGEPTVEATDPSWRLKPWGSVSYR